MGGRPGALPRDSLAALPASQLVELPAPQPSALRRRRRNKVEHVMRALRELAARGYVAPNDEVRRQKVCEHLRWNPGETPAREDLNQTNFGDLHPSTLKRAISELRDEGFDI
jgi:hypothetical protein